ncbi:hypothetical protein H5410_020885, partial [Solanum commersonii]
MKICESPNPFGESPINRILAFCSSMLSPEGNEQIGVLHRPIIQDIMMLKATDERRRSRPKGGSSNASAIPTNITERSFEEHFMKTINT